MHRVPIALFVFVTIIPEVWVLLQAGGDHLLVLLAVYGAGGVDHALHLWEAEGVEEAALLECGQGRQTTGLLRVCFLRLLLRLLRAPVTQAHHSYKTRP